MNEVFGFCLREDLRDRRRQRGLAMVDVTHRPDVEVRLGALELRLAHVLLSVLVLRRYASRGGSLGLPAFVVW